MAAKTTYERLVKRDTVVQTQVEEENTHNESGDKSLHSQ